MHQYKNPPGAKLEQQHQIKPIRDLFIYLFFKPDEFPHNIILFFSVDSPFVHSVKSPLDILILHFAQMR